MMTATLQLTRTWAYLTDRGKWQILIDGTAVGSIDQKETAELPVQPGHHTLRVKTSGRYGSAEHSFDASDGEEVRFSCHAARYWPLMLAATIKPDLWISLRRE
jgi:hypothetical protein